MKKDTKDDFMNNLLKIADKEPEEFKPFAYHNQDGDCVEFFVKPDSYYAERVDGFLTVYRSRKNKEVIGSLLKNIKHIIGKYPGFSIEIHDGKVHLAALFLAGLWSQAHKDKNCTVVRRIYQSLVESAKNIDAEAELQLN